MIGRLVAALGRRSPATRRLTLAALTLVALVVAASTLAPGRHAAHHPVVPLGGEADAADDHRPGLAPRLPA